jgi:hypothetical protein
MIKLENLGKDYGHIFPVRKINFRESFLIHFLAITEVDFFSVLLQNLEIR